MNSFFSPSVLSLIAATGTISALVAIAPAQQGTPSAAPRPQNSQPDPANSQPRPANQPPNIQPQPPQTPGTQNPAPVQNPTPIVQPGQVVAPNGQIIGPNGQVIGPNGQPQPTGLSVRYERPFAFQSPYLEARFNDSSRRLIALEQRMATTNQTLLKRLGEVRALPPDKQNAAVVDLLQQVLLEQSQLQKYLVQARTTWTGDLDQNNPDGAADQPMVAEPVVGNEPTATPVQPQRPQNPPR